MSSYNRDVYLYTKTVQGLACLKGNTGNKQKNKRVYDRNRDWITAKPKQLLSLLERKYLEFLRSS
jgi:hypothetical protein